eukprot:GHVT01042365.1.p1 GENE.GHVT01042365.1~~GHVT01042365.1.p1  ORF type:complete len:346 (-),score=45.46 GHVT01042365.1:276-1313(-)
MPAPHTPSQQSLPLPPLYAPSLPAPPPPCRPRQQPDLTTQTDAAGTPDPELADLTRWFKPAKVKTDPKPTAFSAEMRGSKWLNEAMKKIGGANGTLNTEETAAVMWTTVTAGIKSLRRRGQIDPAHDADVDAAVGEGMAAHILGLIIPTRRLGEMIRLYLHGPRIDYWRVSLADAQGVKPQKEKEKEAPEQAPPPVMPAFTYRKAAAKTDGVNPPYTEQGHERKERRRTPPKAPRPTLSAWRTPNPSRRASRETTGATETRGPRRPESRRPRAWPPSPPLAPRPSPLPTGRRHVPPPLPTVRPDNGRNVGGSRPPNPTGPPRRGGRRNIGRDRFSGGGQPRRSSD